MMIKIWISSVVKPDAQLFASERDKSSATLTAALMWVLIANVVAVLVSLTEGWLIDRWVIPAPEMKWYGSVAEVFSAIGYPLTVYRIRMLQMSFFITDVFAELWLITHPRLSFIYAPFYQVVSFVMITDWVSDTKRVVLNPVYFLIGMGVYHSIAKAMGGQGRIGRYAYLFALFVVPLTVLNSLFSFIPLIGPAIEAGYLAIFTNASSVIGQHWFHALNVSLADMLKWFVSFYSTGLAYLVTKVEHKLVWWRVVVVVVLGFLLNFVIRNSLSYSYWGMMRMLELELLS